MADYEQKTGGQILAIRHNGNLSNGRMSAVEKCNGHPLDRDYAEWRRRLEPLAEITQTKGDSEAHPFLPPGDEFAAFERWDKGNIAGLEAKTRDMLPYEYVRSALKLGLRFKGKRGGVHHEDTACIAARSFSSGFCCSSAEHPTSRTSRGCFQH
jgi:hypothetical protein